MRKRRKFLSVLLALLFFLETTIFASARAVAAQRPAGPVLPNGRPEPYTFAAPPPMAPSSGGGIEPLGVQPHAVNPSTTSRESVSSAEAQGDRKSNAPSTSGDGRFVAFESEARNLVPNDSNGVKDVFVRDRTLGTTTRVNIATGGKQGNGESGEPSISGDGRFVAFESSASNLTPNDKNGKWDIFLHDRESGATTAVTRGDRDSRSPSISADGRYVAFESDARNLVFGDVGGRRDVFVYDRETGVTTLVSVSTGGAQANQNAGNATISGDGRYVAFDSKASNLVVGDSNGANDVFVHDRETGETTLASVDSGGMPGDRDSARPSISAGGRFVAFESGARNLVPGLPRPTSGSSDDDSSDDDSSDDDSSDDDSSDDDSSDDSDDDSSDDDDALKHIYVHDRETGVTTLVSQSTGGVPGDDTSTRASINATGRFVAFASSARNLVSGDTNRKDDVFVRDLAREMTVRVSVGSGGQGDKDSDRPSISGDGTLTAYESLAKNLVPNDTNDKDDVFARESGLNRPPVATDDAAETQTNTPTDVVVLANDEDPDGDTLTVESVDSPSGALLEILDDGAVRYLPPLDFTGPDVFTYTIGDGHGATATATVTVQVNGGNEAPSVDAGPDHQITLPVDAVTLHGTVTDDGLPSGSALSVLWSQLDGPAPATFGTPTDPVTTARFPVAGTYVLKLEADDGALIAFDTVTVLVHPPNQAPVVNAGADQTLVLPQNVATLVGTATDDGEPTGTLTVLWTQVQGPPGVVFTAAASLTTEASFPGAGIYVLRLTADDSALSAFDELTVVVEPPIPAISISGVAVTEGHHGGVLATLLVELSVATERVVSVDYGTLAGTAGSCDYIPRTGTVTFAPGEISREIVVAIVGDLVVEGDESFTVQLVNAVEGTLGSDLATVTILDDDVANQPPTAPGDRLPADRSVGVVAAPTLSWSAGDPDPADTLSFDLYLGTVFDAGGQSWSKTCPTAQAPVPRAEQASGYDAAGDRLLVVGGASIGVALGDVWVLDSASGAGATPSWRPVDAGIGPVARRSASLALDPESGRAVLFGGCSEPCDQALADAWLLVDALTPGGSPSWLRLPDAPSGRLGHSAVFSGPSSRLIVFGGGELPAGDDSSDVWILRDAMDPGSAAWEMLAVAGATPPARRDAAVDYDAESDRLFVAFGRTAAGDVLGDVWVLHHASGLGGAPEWVEILPSGPSPPRRTGAILAHDGASDRLLLFGGASASPDAGALHAFDDAWLLEGPETPTPTWFPVTPPGDRPAGRVRPAAGHSPSNARLVVALGTSPLHPQGLTDVWQLESPHGSLPLVSQGQPGDSYGAPPLPDDVLHYWRVVARDPNGAFQGSTVYRFTPGAPRIGVADGSVVEGDAGTRALTFPLSLSWPRETAVSVDWETSGVTAAGDEDYSEASGTATFPPGETSASITVEVIGDELPEANEAFALTLTNPQGGGVLATEIATGTILDDDAANDPPVVDAGPDQSVDPGPAVLAGSASDDGLPAPGVLTTSWSQVSGPAQVGFADPTALDTTVTLPEAGVYVLRLTASDGALSASDDVEFHVGATNAPPIVSAGPDQILLAPATSTALSGFASDDGLPPGSTLTTLWSLVAGPGPIVFADETALSTTVTLGPPGVYVLRLTASDGELSAEDEMTVTLVHPNAPPLVSAGPDQALTLPVTETVLAGSASDDGVPGGLTTLWSQTSGPAGVVFSDPASPSTNAAFPGVGSYVLRLSASDGELGAFDEVTVTVGDVADLVVDAVDASAASVDGQTLAVSGPIEVTLRNGGVGPSGPFQVAFFEDRDRNGTYDSGTDELLGTVDHPGLASGESVTIGAELSGALLFVGNLVWAFADSTEVVAETDETNNYGNSAPPCEPPPPLPFAPVEEWAWTTTSVSPTWTNVMSTPAVADLDLDGVPDVVFASFPGGAYGGLGLLRALNGADGSELFSATAPGSEVNAVGNVAIGDIDGDSFPEIVTFQGGRPIAFEHDGTRKWLGAAGQQVGWGGPSLADLDGDGLPEIVAGAQVFNSDGSLRWTGTGTTGNVGGTGPLSLVADIDLDGSPEVVAGPTVYRADGSILWRAAGLPDGGTAVGNFDDDPYAEIVLVGSARVWVLEHDGTIKWGPVLHPGGGIPGTPTVADFDNDGEPEIGVAGASRYAVFETNGTVRWSAVTRDNSSSRTGSSVFDFEGDGSAEVVYSDELRLFVFRGTDGAVLFSTPLSSCTTTEYPLVVDVDGDGNAEIVAPANDTCGFGPSTGIHVFGDANDQWVATRRIWNQHTYHINNVNEDGTIPRHESESWLGHNSYRQNLLTDGCAFAQPDVTASYVRIARQGGLISLTARIGNAGIDVGRVDAAFYDGDPRTGGRLLGVARTSSVLPRGAFEDVTLLVPPYESAYPLWVVADDDGDGTGALTESNEENNFYESPFDLVPTANEPPQVDAGPDQATPPGILALAGVVSDDGLPADTLLTVWTVVSGPGVVAFADPGQPATTASFTTPGLYVLRLTATDGDLTAADEVAVTVTPGNLPPLVDAGPDRAATLPEDTVSLLGQASDDGLPGGTLTTTWSQVSGPAPVTFGDPSAPATTATAGVVGRYVLRLSADDGALVASDDMTVLIGDASSLPDLTVGSIDVIGLEVDDRTFALSGDVTAVVTNAGLGPAATPFTLTFFEDRNGNGVFDPFTDGMLGFIELPSLGAGGVEPVSVPLSGTLFFRGNLVYAFVDSASVVLESDETNNYGSSAAPCSEAPPSSEPFRPVVEWAWNGAGSPIPTANDVESAPVVIDLDLDGIPEVVTNSWPGSNQAYLRVLDGRNGKHRFSVTDPALRLYWASHIAAGNIDLDPNPEIVAVANSNNRLLAFEHDGTLKWQSPILETIGYGGAALADLDGDGTPEIVIGRQVLNADGTLRWTGTGGRTGTYAQLSLVADLDLDGVPEIVAGSTAYRADGSIYWRVNGIGEGFNAVGNFDEDAFPEIVQVDAGQVRLLEHNGAVKWGPAAIPGGGQGGPPTVADFDGDGLPEIGVAGSRNYVVFETNGDVRWQAPTQDFSSNRTGSSVFDFEGDGAAEVVYADEVNLRVYRGSDGTVLFEYRMGSGTAVEYPVIADVDADGHAEILAVGSGSPPGYSGLIVFGDAADLWVSTRKIWNQHTYHVDNVADDGSIPSHETNSWDSHNSYRQNLMPRGCATALPDLVAGHLRVTTGPSERSLTVRVGNAGGNPAGSFHVTFYDGGPFSGGAVLGTVSTSGPIFPGSYEDVTLTLSLDVVTQRTLWIVADDNGAGGGLVRESNELNNSYDSGQSLIAAAGVPDLAPARFDLVSAATDPLTLVLSGGSSVEIRNQGDTAAAGFDLTVFADRNANGAFDPGADLVLGSAPVGGVPPASIVVVPVDLFGALLFAGEPIFVFLDSGDVVAESNEDNNVERAGEACVSPPRVEDFSLRVERSWTQSNVSPTFVGVMTTPLVVDLDGDTRPEMVFATHAGTNVTTGLLRAIRGRDGALLFTSATNVRASAQMAVGDIDGDGRPEIVAVAPSTAALIAFEHDGAIKWTSAPIEGVGDGGPSIANVDGAGLPEIVIGRQVLNADGTLRWTGSASTGGFGGSRLSSVADLDGDGLQEIIAGNSAYRSNGTLLWTAATGADGFTAVADVDGDGLPEVLLTNGNRTWCIEHDGVVKWGPITFGTGIWGAPPVIADVDGDRVPEAVVSIDSHLAVIDQLETLGAVRWSTPVNQFREAIPAAFDFDRDGAAEIVFTDGDRLRVLRGSDGSVVGELPLGSFTQRQGVVVADADGDGAAEIVTGASPFNLGTTTPGLYVVGEANGFFQAARRIWNQVSYHVTNVNDDGSVPLVETPSWLGPNSYRANMPAGSLHFGAADLTASYPRQVESPGALELIVRIGNGGTSFAAAGVALSFYDGHPREAGLLLGTVVTTQDLAPGEYEDVSLSLGPGAYAGRTIWAVADDEGNLVGRYAECDESNNFLDTGFSLNEAPVVDAGADQTVVFPEILALLDGAVSDDGLPVGAPVSVRWSQVSGPGLAFFDNPFATGTRVQFTRGGVYVLRLTASDSVLVSADDVKVTVTGPNQPPLVDAGPDALVPHPNDTHLLTGIVNDDGLPLGASVTVQWLQISGPATAVFADAGSRSTMVQLPAVGTYHLRLTASDTALIGADDVTIRRLPPNQAPVVNAGPDRQVSLPANSTTLTGSATDDSQPVGVALVYAWTVVSGPGVVVFSAPGAATTLATFGSVGTYVLRLTVSDSELASSDEVTVEILPQNLPPAVDARPDREIDAAETLLIEAAVSDDGLPPPPALTLAWSKVSGPGAVVFSDPSAATTSVQFGQTGPYVLRLSAHDGALSASDDVSVTVRAGNVAPLVSAGPDRTLQKPASVLTLTGSASDDGLPEGSTLSVLWSVVSGPGPVVLTTPASPVSQASFTIAGTYVLRLTATDTAATRSDDVTVVVLPQNKAPLVNAGPDQNLVAPPASEIVLLGSVSDDGLPQGASLVSLWQQLSGPAAVVIADPSSPVTTTNLPALGVYVFRLRASDSLLQAFDDVTVRVADGNQPPTVDAGPDQNLVAPTYTASLAGVVADDGLPVGSMLSAQWSLVTGPALPAFANAASPVTTVTLPSPGTYVLRLVVSDSVHTRVDTMSVTLQAAPPVGPPPVVAILSPADGSALTEPASIVGTVASEALQRWTLEYRAAGDASWLPLGEGAVPVAAAPLGALDPTLLLNGVYELRLTATDLAARTTRVSSSVVVRDNQKVGHFSVSFVDLEVPVAGLPIRVTRTYDSRDKARGDFGHGWRLSLSDVKIAEASMLGLAWTASTTPGGTPSYCLSLARSAVVTITLPDGQTFEFDPKLNRECWSFVPPSAVTLSFKARPGTIGSLSVLDGADAFVTTSWPSPGQSHATLLVSAIDFDTLDPDLYQLTLPDGRAFVVRQGKGLQSLTDLNGNRLTVSPNGIQYQNPAVAGSALGVSFLRDGLGRIQSITDPLGNVMRYEYDGAGDLVTFKDREENATTFTYEPAFPHHLREIVDPLGRAPIKNEYYDDGRLKSHTDAFGNTILYTHSLSARQEIVTDREGGVRVLDYDARGNVIHEVDAEGRVVDRTFDARNNRLSETESYDSANPPVPIPTTLFTYDAQDNLLSMTDPLGNRTEYTYNARKQVLAAKDARGVWTENAYNDKGELTRTRSGAMSPGGPALSETTFTYDAQGNVKTMATIVSGVPHVTSYAYDARGNLLTETDAEGNTTSYTYDATGNRKTQTMTRTTPGGIETLITTYEYDREGRLTKVIDPDGTFTETVYDALGRQKETFDKLRRKTSYDYDLMGRLLTTTYPDDTTEEATYDGEGRRLTSRDRAGKVTTYEYDQLGRLLKTVYPDTTSTENHYDSAGRIDWTKDARGKTSFFEYDAAGRRTGTRMPLGAGVFAETRFTYDANGNQDSVTDPEGRTTNYTYDALNRLVRTTFPERVVGEPRLYTETVYDELGRRIAERDAAGNLTEFRYDKLGRLVRVIDAEGQETVYGYDEVGNRVTQTDAEGRTTSFEYDNLGRQTSRILPGGDAEGMTYDAAGNVRTRTDFIGRVTSFAYDDMNRLLTRSYPEPHADQNVGFTYWPNGLRRSVTDARGTTTYDYDLRDRVKELVYPDGRKLEYVWDGNGNRTSLIATLPTGGGGSPLVLTTGYSYDDASRLDLVTDPAGRVYDHGYDRNGNRTSLVQPNATTTAYAYDALNRLKSLVTTRVPGGAVIQSYDLELGPAGNRTRITEAGSFVKEYGYDDVYRLTSETVTGLLNYGKTFVYDRVGNRREQVRTGSDAGPSGATAYAYDDRDRLLLEGAQSYGWDENGNLTSKAGEAAYVWDLENRLIRVEKTDGTVVEHAYDADGNRVRTEVTPPTGPPTTTEFLVDTSGSLSQVVAETDAAGTLLAYYVRGDDLLAVMRPLVPTPAVSAEWQSRFYHADYIGSIRRLTNEDGFITDGYTYTAFGELIGHTGTDPQPYAFAGEPLDPNSGWQYHRARWMDPAVGRFASVDPFEGNRFDPPSLHRYLYAAESPLNNVDPTGEFTLPEISVGLAIRSVIQTIAISAPLRALHAAQQLRAGSDLGAVAQEFAIGLATDVAIGALTFGVLQYAPRLFQIRAVGQAIQRAANSPWKLNPFARGREIEKLILGSRAGKLPSNFPVIDDFFNGVATSIKSIDLTASTYASTSNLIGQVSRYARSVANFGGIRWAGLTVPPAGQRITERVLVLAIEKGAATADQAAALARLLRQARYTWPNIKILLAEIP